MVNQKIVKKNEYGHGIASISLYVIGALFAILCLLPFAFPAVFGLIGMILAAILTIAGIGLAIYGYINCDKDNKKAYIFNTCVVLIPIVVIIIAAVLVSLGGTNLGYGKILRNL